MNCGGRTPRSGRKEGALLSLWMIEARIVAIVVALNTPSIATTDRADMRSP